MGFRTKRLTTISSDCRGAAAIEFAIVGPIFFITLIGILFYGGYFWIAHSVQQLANDSARASIAGVDAEERREIAEEVLAGAIGSYSFLDPSAATITIDDEAQRIAINVAYDASRSPFFSLDGFIPMPSSMIRRQAVVRLGGY